MRTFLHTLGTFLRTFGSHLCVSELPALSSAALAHIEHRLASVVVHVDLPAHARGQAKVIGVTTGNRRAGHVVVRVCRRHIYKVRTVLSQTRGSCRFFERFFIFLASP